MNECPFCCSPLEDTFGNLLRFKCGSFKPIAKNTKATQSQRCMKTELNALQVMVSNQGRRIVYLEGELKAATQRPSLGGTL